MPTQVEIAEALARIERQTAKITETVGIVDERQKAQREDIIDIKEHLKESNGRMAMVISEQHETKGAVGMLKWMLSFTLTGIGVGAALAGVILAYVSGG